MSAVSAQIPFVCPFPGRGELQEALPHLITFRSMFPFSRKDQGLKSSGKGMAPSPLAGHLLPENGECRRRERGAQAAEETLRWRWSLHSMIPAYPDQHTSGRNVSASSATGDALAATSGSPSSRSNQKSISYGAPASSSTCLIAAADWPCRLNSLQQTFLRVSCRNASSVLSLADQIQHP